MFLQTILLFDTVTLLGVCSLGASLLLSLARLSVSLVRRG